MTLPVPISAIAPEDELRYLTAEELGCTLRLADLAWTRDGRIPAAPEVLSRVCGTLTGDLATVWPAIARVLRPSEAGQDYTLPAVVALLDDHRAQHARKSAAARAANEARWGRGRKGSSDPPRIRTGSESDPSRIPDASAPIPPPHPPSSSGGLCAHAHRSQERSESSAPPESARAGAAVPSGGARAMDAAEASAHWLRGQVAQWHIDQCLALVREAATRWAEMGRIGGRSRRLPESKIEEIARSEHATPARIDQLVHLADDYLMDEARARQQGRPCPYERPTRPVAVLMGGLAMGVRQLDRTPRLVSRTFQAKWDEEERKFRARLAVAARVEGMRIASREAHTSAVPAREA